MKKIIIAAAVIAASFAASAQVYHRGYTTRNGTYVQPKAYMHPRTNVILRMKRLSVIVLVLACTPLWAQVREPKCSKSAVQAQCSPLDGGATVHNPNVAQTPD